MLSDDLLPHGMKISRVTVDHVFVQDRTGLELPMRDISDGCRGVHALVLDLIQAMADLFGMEGLFIQDDGHVVINHPGVVLIDEIEAHLHPAWQRDIPEWLKSHFPKVQFMVTTHSPLVAQAADPNGAFVLPSPGDPCQETRMLTGAEYEKLRLGRAEKTLLGIAFGLHSVRSNWAKRQIQRWQLLDARKRALGNLPDAEKKEYDQLHEQMEMAFDRMPDHMAP
ncbi:MAG: AAA family ATPase [Magnetococcales bacterium]|nr:AAA family ATPase [Magnetococcales bacterium]